MRPQVPSERYFTESYDFKERFISYWHQINEVILLRTSNILEIGVGNGFVSNYLKGRGLKVTTLDINDELNPNVVGDVLTIPFIDKLFNIVTCYEVLEHLPYKNFSEALREIHRVSLKYVILSLPDVTTVYRFNIELPRIKPIKKLIPHPFPRPASHEFDGQHCWEIGKKGYPFNDIVIDIKRTGFKIIKTYRVFEFYYHRFFLLEKVN